MRTVSLVLLSVASASNTEGIGLLQPNKLRNSKSTVDAEPQCKYPDLAGQLSLSLEPVDTFDTSTDVTRVVMADFPTMGSSWLRMMMRRISWMVGLQSPVGAIYEEEPFTKQVAFETSETEGVFVDSGWTHDMGSVMFKTHWPADIELEGPRSPSKMAALHNASVRFEKAVVLLRHPHSLVKANYKRWDTDCYMDVSCVAQGVLCWVKFWETMLAEKVKQKKVHFVRYEDLCVNPVKKIKEVFDFLGGPYAEIESSQIQGYFTGNYTDWRECIYTAADLHNQAKAFDLISGETTDDHSLLSMYDNTWFSHFYNMFELP